MITRIVVCCFYIVSATTFTVPSAIAFPNSPRIVEAYPSNMVIPTAQKDLKKLKKKKKKAQDAAAGSKKKKKKQAGQIAPADKKKTKIDESAENEKKMKAKAERREKRRKAKKVKIEKKKKVVVTPGGRKSVKTHKRTVTGRNGRVREVKSRNVRIVDNRHHNRYHNGRSVFYDPPVGSAIVAGAFIVGAAIVTSAVIHETLAAPPVVGVPRAYTIDEIVEDPAIRQKVRGVDVDSITFASGQSRIPPRQVHKLDNIAGAMSRILAKHPRQVFLIEGHTDAVGSAEFNLDLSEDRATAVKIALSEVYGIPDANTEAVGYGEQYLKVQTQGPSRQNRRVTIRNISGLLRR